MNIIRWFFPSSPTSIAVPEITNGKMHQIVDEIPASFRQFHPVVITLLARVDRTVDGKIGLLDVIPRPELEAILTR